MKYYITNAHFMITEQCNLRCNYCYVCKENKTMTKEVGEQGVDFLIKGAKKGSKKKIIVTFFGGEPTLNIPLMNHIFDYALMRTKEENLMVDFVLITNGMIFNEELKTFLIKWKKECGMINVQLSFDGTPEVQSINRPFYNQENISFTSGEKMEINLGLIKNFCEENNIKLGKEFYIHSVVPKNQLKNLYKNYYYFTEKGFKGFWHILLLEDDWDNNDVIIYKEQLDLIFNYVIKNKYYDHFLYNKMFHKKERQPVLPCTAGRELCCINTDGVIYACHRLYQNDKTDILGYLNKDGKIWIDEDKKQIYDKLTTNDFIGEKLCKDCNVTNCFRCLGSNKNANGLLTLCFPLYCKMARVEQELQNKIRNYLNENNLIEFMNDNQAIKDSSENTFDDNSVKETLEHLVNGFKELTEILSEGFEKLEQKQDDLLNLFIANLLQKND